MGRVNYGLFMGERKVSIFTWKFELHCVQMRSPWIHIRLWQLLIGTVYNKLPDNVTEIITVVFVERYI